MERRAFLRNSTTLIGAFPLIQLNQLKYFSTRRFIEVNVVRMKVGKFECMIFRDFMYKYRAKDFFINANEQELNQTLDKYHFSADNIPSPFIAILLQLGDKKILIDSGVGFSEKPVIVRENSVLFKGRLQQLLQQENVKKEEITDVIITHFHPDHIGGIFSEDEKLNFPNAKFHLHEDEWNYWHTSASDNQAPLFKYFVNKNVTKLKGYNLNLIKGDFVDLLPGITAVKGEGHTPGHIALIIQSEKMQLLYISDTFLNPIHIERLDWETNYDLDHVKAKQSRIKLLELAHKNDMLVNAFHFDFPGLGRIDKNGSDWIWKYSEK